MDQENLKIVQEIIGAIGVSGQLIVGEYIKWFIISSVCWLALGIYAMRFCYKWDMSKYEDKDCLIHPVVFKVSGFCIGAVIVCFQVPDLLSPTAAAIHQLIVDVKI